MQEREPEFRLVPHSEMCDKRAEEIRALLERHQRKSSGFLDIFLKWGGRLIGISHKGKLVSFMMYSKPDRQTVHVDFRYSGLGPKTLKVFVKKFGVSPAQYFREHFIRQGIGTFTAPRLTQSGYRFQKRLVKSGLAKSVESGKWKVTPKGAAAAKQRMHRLP